MGAPTYEIQAKCPSGAQTKEKIGDQRCTHPSIMLASYGLGHAPIHSCSSVRYTYGILGNSSGPHIPKAKKHQRTHVGMETLRILANYPRLHPHFHLRTNHEDTSRNRTSAFLDGNRKGHIMPPNMPRRVDGETFQSQLLGKPK